jgi:hypothetical protein
MHILLVLYACLVVSFVHLGRLTIAMNLLVAGATCNQLID